MISRPQPRLFKVEYVRASDGEVVDAYDCEAYSPEEALLDASWHFERASREYAVDAYRVLDPATGVYHHALA